MGLNLDFQVDGDGPWLQGSLVIQTVAIPEPATYGMMGLGLAVFGAVARRRRH